MRSVGRGEEWKAVHQREIVNECKGDVNEKVPWILWETVIESRAGSEAGAV